jgi:hypothetical protein
VEEGPVHKARVCERRPVDEGPVHEARVCERRPTNERPMHKARANERPVHEPAVEGGPHHHWPSHEPAVKASSSELRFGGRRTRHHTCPECCGDNDILDLGPNGHDVLPLHLGRELVCPVRSRCKSPAAELTRRVSSMLAASLAATIRRRQCAPRVTGKAPAAVQPGLSGNASEVGSS